MRDAGGARGWLFGTVHALPDGLDWRTAELEEALAKADLLVVEIAELEDAAAGERVFAAVSRTPGLPPLTRRVAAADRPALAALLLAAGLEENDFADIESWAAALLLGSAVREYDPAEGVDRALLAEADEVVGLETYAEQFARFDTLPADAQTELLAQTAGEFARKEQGARIEAWLTGDVARLEELSSGGLLDEPAMREALLVARNREWVVAIERMMDAGNQPFVAVGAAHMLGDDGLPALLAARGWTVERLQ